jgi:hypothetical protein
MRKSIFLIPLIAPMLTGCMADMINSSTQSIHQNRMAVERSTEAIRENQESIRKSTETMDKNKRLLDAANEH